MLGALISFVVTSMIVVLNDVIFEIITGVLISSIVVVVVISDILVWFLISKGLITSIVLDSLNEIVWLNWVIVGLMTSMMALDVNVSF